jgi:hypothetical protein
MYLSVIRASDAVVMQTFTFALGNTGTGVETLTLNTSYSDTLGYYSSCLNLWDSNLVAPSYLSFLGYYV